MVADSITRTLRTEELSCRPAVFCAGRPSRKLECSVGQPGRRQTVGRGAGNLSAVHHRAPPCGNVGSKLHADSTGPLGQLPRAVLLQEGDPAAPARPARAAAAATDTEAAPVATGPTRQAVLGVRHAAARRALPRGRHRACCRREQRRMLRQVQGAGRLRGVFVWERVTSVHAQTPPVRARGQGCWVCVREV